MNARSSTRRHPDGIVRIAGPGFFPVEFLAKLPLAMTLVGILELMTSSGRSISEAALASGALGVASALAGPGIGHLADRYGQRIVLIPVAVTNGAGLLVLAAGANQKWPFALLIAVAAVIGASSPQIGSMGRARWIGMTARSDTIQHLNRAMSWETTTDELTFIIGPLLVAAATSLISPTAPIIAAAVLVLIFAVGFALHPTHIHAARHGRGRGAASAALPMSGPLLLVVAGMTVIGMFWGVALTSATQLAARAGAAGAGGFIYGAMGLGAAAAAVFGGALPQRLDLRWRWVLGSALGLAFTCPLLSTHHPIAAGVWYFLLGFGLGGAIVSLFTIAAKEAPAGRATSVMAVLGSASMTGQAVSTSLNGLVLDSFGISAGYAIGTALFAVLLALALLSIVVSRRPDRSRLTVPNRTPARHGLVTTREVNQTAEKGRDPRDGFA